MPVRWGRDRHWSKSWRWDIDDSGDTLWLQPPLRAESATLPSIVSGGGDSSRKDLPPDTVRGSVGTTKRGGGGCCGAVADVLCGGRVAFVFCEGAGDHSR